MADALFELSHAIPADAAEYRFTGFSLDGRTADRAMVGKMELPFLSCSDIGDDFHDFRDDVAGARDGAYRGAASGRLT